MLMSSKALKYAASRIVETYRAEVFVKSVQTGTIKLGLCTAHWPALQGKHYYLACVSSVVCNNVKETDSETQGGDSLMWTEEILKTSGIYSERIQRKILANSVCIQKPQITHPCIYSYVIWLLGGVWPYVIWLLGGIWPYVIWLLGGVWPYVIWLLGGVSPYVIWLLGGVWPYVIWLLGGVWPYVI
jgi:hypothetical protein